MRIGGAGPLDDLVAPVGRRHRGDRRGAVAGPAAVHRGAGRDVELEGQVPDRVRDGQLAQHVDAVDRSVGVDGRVALVGRNLVVDEAAVARPAPLGQDHVALGARRPRRRGRHRAVHDPVRPVRERPERPLPAHPVDAGVHSGPGGADQHALLPGVERRVVVVQVRHLARREVAHLVAELAAVLQAVHPLGLVAHLAADAVAARSGARELAGVRHLQQGIPVVRGVDGGGVARVGRDGRRQLDVVARPGGDRRGVDQAVAAGPDLVVGVRQVREEEAAVVAGDHDLAEHGLQVVGGGDDPDAGLGAGVAADDAADHAVVAGRGHGRAARPQHAGRRGQRRAGEPRPPRNRVSHCRLPPSRARKPCEAARAASAMVVKGV